MTALVYQYGLLRPIQNAEDVADQMRLAHRYANKLVEIERERRAAIRAATAIYPNIEALTAEVAVKKAALDDALAIVTGKRSETRKRSETDLDKQRIKNARGALAIARKSLNETRKALYANPDVQAAFAAAETRAHDRLITERGQSGVYWGTYLAIEQAHEQVCDVPMYADPKFQSWEGEGLIAVQIQKGMAPSELDRDTRLRMIDVVMPKGHTQKAIQMRVGSKGRAPIWATFPIARSRHMRELPQGARISGAKVTCQRRGLEFVWKLNITVDLEAGWVREPHGKGAVAIDLGWRLREGALRVGYLKDDAGRSEEILLDAGIPERLNKADSLRSIRDLRQNEMQPLLAAWLRAATLPAWLAEWTPTIAQWEAATRFHGLARAWRGSRFEGDAEGYEILEAWRKKDEHLWSWESHERKKTLGRRREFYRVFSARLARQYETLVLEAGLDLRVFQASNKTEDEAEIAAQKLQQRQACVSSLRECLVQAFLVRGGEIVYVPCADTTQSCYVCATIDEWDHQELSHTCSSCRTTWDQDANAAANLLAWRERDDAKRERGGARAKGPGRFARAKAVKALREAAEEAGARAEGVKGAGSKGE